MKTTSPSPSTISHAFTKLSSFAEEIAVVRSAASTLGWDQETYMPDNALNHRSRQLAWLSGRAHEMATGDTFSTLLSEAEREAAEASWTDTASKADLREWRHRFDQSKLFSTEFVEEFTRTTTQAKSAWADARQKNDFPRFAPWLSKILELNLRKAEIRGYEAEPYDALLSEYERGATTAAVISALEPLRTEGAVIAREAVERSRVSRAKLPAGPYPVEAQIAFNREVAEAIGFDFEGGRIDTTAHPFCTDLGPGDVRLTTRYDESDFTSSLFGVMHEAGHGMYEQGLRHDRYGRPSGESVSLGIHESQSRLWENHVGLSREFWNVWFSRAQHHFKALRKLSLESFLQALRRVDYSLIRVEADEVTYDLHILVRFDIERRLTRGELKVKDVPAAWNSLYQEFLGILPPSDSLGCLQDIHWSMGAIGYFPTYSLGNLNAAQIFATAKKDPAVGGAIQNGDYLPLREWLRKKIHTHGSIYLPAELMKRATKRETRAAPYLEHLRARYL